MTITQTKRMEAIAEQRTCYEEERDDAESEKSEEEENIEKGGGNIEGVEAEDGAGVTHGHSVHAFSYAVIPTLPQHAITVAPPEFAPLTWSDSRLPFKGLACPCGIDVSLGTMVITTQKQPHTREPPPSIAREQFVSNTSGPTEWLSIAKRPSQRPS
ncbi:hypothetical protein L873DRAFT_1841614 [Choiromyces venosus 120613-1]|uniref:Uncharacterized protein n=1 Tax=Choiromyces venosus 120613-1 TaxID=1336337 RepID=A0A3N4K0B5_9PEZI|nr:hypothetical protein L873DRAFT_1841614 [Choiromyces venosus 120613-1]